MRRSTIHKLQWERRRLENKQTFHRSLRRMGREFFVDLSGNTFDIRNAGAQSHPAIYVMTYWVLSKPATLEIFIQVSDATTKLLSRLLIALWYPQHAYLINLDAKTKPENAVNVQRVIGSVSVYLEFLLNTIGSINL